MKVYSYEIFKTWSYAKVYVREIYEYWSSAEVDFVVRLNRESFCPQKFLTLKQPIVTVDTKFTVGVIISYQLALISLVIIKQS